MKDAPFDSQDHSPCKDCSKNDLPRCITGCRRLEWYQTILKNKGPETKDIEGEGFSISPDLFRRRGGRP